MSEGQPAGDLALKIVAMPADTNPAGDIFGGWLMAQMDLSAGTAESGRARGRTEIVSISHFNFQCHIGRVRDGLVGLIA